MSNVAIEGEKKMLVGSSVKSKLIKIKLETTEVVDQLRSKSSCI